MINQIDAEGKKQGHWIYYGRPDSGYPKEGKIEEWTYFDSGQLERKDVHKPGYDSSYYYFESGCLSKISAKPSTDPGKNFITRYGQDSCNQILDTIIDTFEVRLGDMGTIRETSHCTFKDPVPARQNDVSWRCRKPDACLYYTNAYICKDLSNGYLKSYNAAGEIVFDGDCRRGYAYDGKFYFYDDDGILLRVEVWKNAKFYSEGQL